MRNPFMMLTEVSVEHPKKAFGAIMLTVLLLASGAMHLQFDNSEDGFFPDDPSVDLLNDCLLYTSPSPRDRQKSRMPSSA